MLKKIEKLSEKHILSTASIMFLLGILIIYFRCPYIISHPTIYAEDGIWFSNIINNGFFKTLLFARHDYFVFGNIICLKCALLINQLFHGLNLEFLPSYIAVMQFIVFSFTATLPVICLKKQLTFSYRAILWILILLVPLGHDGFEIYGRLLNIGYLFYFIAVNLLFYRITNLKKEKKQKIKNIIYRHIIIFLLYNKSFRLSISNMRFSIFDHRTVFRIFK